MELTKGQYYHIREDIKCKASENPLKYCGREIYNGQTKYSFFDNNTRLFHWINPSFVEPVIKTAQT